MSSKIILFLTLGLFLFFLLPPTDPDLGWHLRCGQEFWQKRSFCEQNQFTVLLPNYFWPNHHWLYQAIIYPVFRIFGLWGLTILNAFLMTLAFFFFYQFVRLKEFFIFYFLFFILIAWGVFSFGLRSQLTGFFFFSLILYLTTSLKQKPKIVVFYPLIFLFWANLHGGSVILGLFLLSFVLLSFVLTTPSFSRLVFSIFSLLFSFFVTFLNPFGLKIYQEAWRHFAGVDLSQLIAEWVPPTPFLWWLILLSSLLLFILLATAGTKNLVWGFLLLIFGFLALKARRHVPFLLLLEFFLFFNWLSALRPVRLLKSRASKDFFALCLVLLLLFFGFFLRLPLTIKQLASWQSYCDQSGVVYPCRAVEFLRQQESHGNLFNRYEWGGFLIWQLPNFKIFVDGRMPAWPTPSGKSPYTLYLETLQTQPGWQETLKNYNIDWILITPGTFTDLKLRPDPGKFGWQEVYRDKISVIYNKLTK